jgi:fatty acid synthase
MTKTAFENVCKPKADATINLDHLSRKLNPKLDYFVCFSSFACGRGNYGQSNYGFANSVMERVCESRRDNGYHGLAIQWGAIGDVGYVIDNFQENDVVIGGTIPQRLSSCLATLDKLLNSSYSVCSSMILADLKVESMGKKESLVETVAHVLGVREYANIAPNTTLVELGMDSLMAVEIRQILQTDYDLVMSLQEIRKLNVSKMSKISDGLQRKCYSDC